MNTRLCFRWKKRLLTLLLGLNAFCVPSEGGGSRLRRTRLACGAALLTAATAASGFWFYPETPLPPSNPCCSGDQEPIASFVFSNNDRPYQEVFLFDKDWIDHSVAAQIKAKLEAEFPETRSLPNWDQPGLPIPITRLTLEACPEPGMGYVRLSGLFFDVRSTNPIDLGLFQQQQPMNVEFIYRRLETKTQGASLHLKMRIRFDPDRREVNVLSTEGVFLVFAGQFNHKADFHFGHWVAKRD